MREPERIDRMLDLVRELWKRYPDLRFNQLMDSLTREFRQENDDADLFYLEDDLFEKFLQTKISNK